VISLENILLESYFETFSVRINRHNRDSDISVKWLTAAQITLRFLSGTFPHLYADMTSHVHKTLYVMHSRHFSHRRTGGHSIQFSAQSEVAVLQYGGCYPHCTGLHASCKSSHISLITLLTLQELRIQNISLNSLPLHSLYFSVY
jgi:hypothetical protein